MELLLNWLQQNGAFVTVPYFAVALFALSIFKWADGNLHPDLKAHAKQWFLPTAGTQRVNVTAAFVDLFEAVFGERHFSIKCIWRSAVASTLFLSLITLIRIMTLKSWPTNPLGYQKQMIQELSYAGVGIFISVYVINILVDYVSLFQSRLVFREMKKRPFLAWPLVFADFILTLAIYILVVYLAVLLIVNFVEPRFGNSFEPKSLFEFASYLIGGILNNTNKGFDARMDDSEYIAYISSLLTTYMTSLWLWITLIGGPLVRMALWNREHTLTKVGKILDAENKPFTALGNTIAFFLTSIGLFHWFISRLVLLFT